MPTLDEYKKSGGYEKDAQSTKALADYFAKLNSPSSSSSSNSNSVYSNPASNQVYNPSSSGTSALRQAYESRSTPAITQQATNNSQSGLPSWMGNSYSKVPGTDYYST